MSSLRTSGPNSSEISNDDGAGWSDRPTLTEFVDRHASLGATGRRLALLDRRKRAGFLLDVRQRLEPLTSDDFLDSSDVIVATASAP